jgi:hypothetical protein
MPVIAGLLVVVLALPVFLAADWPLGGWILGACLWAVGQILGLVLSRRGIDSPTLRGSGVVAFGMFGRGIVLMAVAIAVATYDKELALGGALVYAAAYTVELALSLTSYYSGSDKNAAPPTADRGRQR